jgi:hypothetical protein
MLRAGVHLEVGWHWVYRSGRECSIGYEVQTLDEARPSLRLFYSRTRAGTGEREPVDYPVRLTTTRPRFGELRWWFVCPLFHDGWPCGRRVGKLYLPPGARYFGCRHCHDLTYTSCQISRRYDGLARLLARQAGMDADLVRWAMNRIGKGRSDA